MERKITLMVFLLASVLVLAGFAANEKAYAGLTQSPPFGDFTCWESVEPGFRVGTIILIQDQFGDPYEHGVWGQAEYCAATEKNGELSPYTFDGLNQHYQGWFYEGQVPPGPGTGILVNIQVPQFDDIQVTLGELDQILVPANKFLAQTGGPILSVDLEHHWNCYDITGQAGPPDSGLLQLKTEHGLIQEVAVGEPFLFCAPMLKDDQFGDKDLDEHMICYDIDTTDAYDATDLPIFLADQLTSFSPIPFQINFAIGNNGLEKLCVPAFKSFPAIGGISIPIDTSALLLAGAQSISMWMIPVVIAGIGIGVFVIKRRN